VAEDIRKQDVEGVLIAGDLTGHVVPHRSTPEERGALMEFLDAIDRPAIIIRGNHDVPHDHDYLNYLKVAGGRVIYSEGIDFIETDWVRLVTLPWMSASQLPPGVPPELAIEGMVREVLLRREVKDSFRNFNGPRLVLAHAAFRGGQVRTGQPTTPTADPVLDPKEILRDTFADCILAGHYHGHQLLPGVGLYGGSLFASQFGESSEKVWTIVHHESGKELTLEDRPVPQPGRVLIDYDPAVEKVLGAEGIRTVQAEFLKFPMTLGEFAEEASRWSPDHFKLRVWMDETEVARLTPRVSEVVARLGKVGLSVKVEPVIDRAEKVRTGADDVAKATTLVEKFEAFIQSSGDLAASGVSHSLVARAKEILVAVERDVDGGEDS
jgi:DNA repair exonuclease SbcCD nuclease subunit